MSPRGSFRCFAHVAVPSPMQERVQLEGTTGKLGNGYRFGPDVGVSYGCRNCRLLVRLACSRTLTISL